MLREQTFSDISNYPKPVNPDWQSAVAEYLEEVGATDLDSPNAPNRKVPRTEAELCAALEGSKRKAADKKAQAEHQEALARLADGTAVHRQKKERTPVVQSKARAVKPRRNSSNDKPIAAARRASIVKTLNNGGKIELERQVRTGSNEVYQAQYADIRWIIDKYNMNIKRIKSVTSSASYFVLDTFARYQAPAAINASASGKDNMLTALLSKKLVLASDVTGTNKLATATILKLATCHDLDVYSVFNIKSAAVGWIYILDEEKRKAKISEIGNMLDALDFLAERKLRKKNDRLPMHVPDVILDAAFREFKRVAKDAGATIEEVLAVKEGQ